MVYRLNILGKVILKAIFVLSDGINVNGSELVKGLNDMIFKIPYSQLPLLVMIRMLLSVGIIIVDMVVGHRPIMLK